jgi:hypothetical protein
MQLKIIGLTAFHCILSDSKKTKVFIIQKCSDDEMGKWVEFDPGVFDCPFTYDEFREIQKMEIQK